MGEFGASNLLRVEDDVLGARSVFEDFIMPPMVYDPAGFRIGGNRPARFRAVESFQKIHREQGCGDKQQANSDPCRPPPAGDADLMHSVGPECHSLRRFPTAFFEGDIRSKKSISQKDLKFLRSALLPADDTP